MCPDADGEPSGLGTNNMYGGYSGGGDAYSGPAGCYMDFMDECDCTVADEADCAYTWVPSGCDNCRRLQDMGMYGGADDGLYGSSDDGLYGGYDDGHGERDRRLQDMGMYGGADDGLYG